ncbi:Blue-light-activated protein [Roseovarius albus]|uniref:histidine kinase n=1 Tax=Roseovarius albus TaxID=1247867 RepID=A0A1X6YZE6_9RHOB|nr:Blue-light-activated protein [Roseovarius albus]
MSKRLGSGIWFVLGVSVIIIFVAEVFVKDALQLAMLLTGFTCLYAALLIGTVRAGHAWITRQVRRIGRDICEAEVLPAMFCLPSASGFYANASAQTQFGDLSVRGPRAVLGEFYADPEAVMVRLQRIARAQGHARDELSGPPTGLQLLVRHLGQGHFLWQFGGKWAGQDNPEDSLPLPVFTVGPSGEVMEQNAAADDVFGPRVIHLSQICDMERLEEGGIHNFQTKHKQAKHKKVSCLVGQWAMDAKGTQRKVVLAPLSDSETSFRREETVFGDLPVPLLKLKRNGRIVLSNRSARQLIGQHAVPGQRLEDLLEGLGRSIIDWLGDAVAERGEKHSEVLRVKDAERQVFVRIALERIQENGETLLIAVLSDATELKSLEAQFVQSQKMEAIGQLAGGVAHDFNNLLTAISGHCDLLLLRHDPEESVYADLMQISQNTNRAAALVSQLLAFSRKQTLKPKVIEMHEILSDLTHLLNRLVGETVSLSVYHGMDLWAIRADQRQLEQVLMNLVVNARDAMPEGGEIKIETSNYMIGAPLERDRATVAVGRYVKVEVSDEGCGIPQEKMQKIFEPFYTTKRAGEGTGLGLSTAYGIIKQTGGFIFADSKLGEGTKFTLILPVHEREKNEVEQAHISEQEVVITGGVVLLVEDEAPVRAFASRALQMRGYTVIEAASGEQALTLLQDVNLQVDVFVTDVILPGMDGPSWVREALEGRPKTASIFVSGYAEESFSDQQDRIDHSAFLQKPFSLIDLTGLVGQKIQQKRMFA